MKATYQTCLLIDDDSLDNWINLRLLISGDFANNIIVSGNPAEALESLRRGTISPDVIFLDIRMPSMDGFAFLEAYERIAVSKKEVKIYLLTWSYDPRDVKRSLANKYVTKIIHKPLTREVIHKLVA